MNTTDSAVRITHIPTKLWSNVKMKDHNIKIKTCFKMLKARLYEHEIEKKRREQKRIKFKNRYRAGHQVDLMYYNIPAG